MFPVVNVAEGVVAKETAHRCVFVFCPVEATGALWFRSVNSATIPATWTSYVKILHKGAFSFQGAIIESLY